MLKNPSSLKIDIDNLLEWDDYIRTQNKYSEQSAKDNASETEQAYTVKETNNDSSQNDNADVELIIEDEINN